jgi:hypothetical protein
MVSGLTVCYNTAGSHQRTNAIHSAGPATNKTRNAMVTESHYPRYITQPAKPHTRVKTGCLSASCYSPPLTPDCLCPRTANSALPSTHASHTTTLSPRYSPLQKYGPLSCVTVYIHILIRLLLVWRYSPGWALASIPIRLQTSRSLALPLHSFIHINTN